MSWLDTTVDRCDRIDLRWLLLPNGFIALWVILAHGGALLLVHYGKIPASDYGRSLDEAYFTVSAASFVLLSAILGWFVPRARASVFRAHAIILAIFALFQLGYGLAYAINGIPRVKAFTWNAGAFAFAIAYPVYFARRVLLPHGKAWFVRYAHVVALATSVVISGFVFWRLSEWQPNRALERTPIGVAAVRERFHGAAQLGR